MLFCIIEKKSKSKAGETASEAPEELGTHVKIRHVACSRDPSKREKWGDNHELWVQWETLAQKTNKQKQRRGRHPMHLPSTGAGMHRQTHPHEWMLTHSCTTHTHQKSKLLLKTVCHLINIKSDDLTGMLCIQAYNLSVCKGRYKVNLRPTKATEQGST